METQATILTENDLDFVRVVDTWPSTFSTSKFNEFLRSIQSGDTNRMEISDLNLDILIQQADISINPGFLKHVKKIKGDLSNIIFSTLTNGRFRKGFRCFVEGENSKDIRNKIEKAIKNNRPVEIVLPCLPFKDGNPLRSRLPHDIIDLGEIACILRMFEICRAIETVFSPGCIVTLITDGVIYSDLFGAIPREAIKYRKSIEDLIFKMNIREYIHVVDMAVLVGRFWKEFELVKSKIAEELESDDKWFEKISQLQQGVAANLNLTDVPLEILFHIFNTSLDAVPQNMANKTTQWKKNIWMRAKRVAIDYAAVLLSIKKLKIIETAFPNSIRATVHPKPGQLGLFLVNNLSALGPYHGVPLLTASTNGDINLKSIRIRYELDVRSRHNVRPVYIKDQRFPLFFEEYNNSS